VSVKQNVKQAIIQSRQYVNYKSERLYGTRSSSITFRKELHEISLKSTKQFSPVTDRQAGRVYYLHPAVTAHNGRVSLRQKVTTDNGRVSVVSGCHCR